MDFDLKLKALDGLAASKSDEADAALKREVAKAAAVLQADSRYNLLQQQLKILKSIGHRASRDAVQTLRMFIERVQSLEITYSAQEVAFGDQIREYFNAASLTVDAIDVLLRLRYLETTAVLALLMDVSLNDSEDVRKRALHGLEEIASYKIDVIYGDGKQVGIALRKQKYGG
jgi:flagellar motor switch protein FliM